MMATQTNLPSSIPCGKRVQRRADSMERAEQSGAGFAYDYMSRRISKTVGRRTGGGLWQLMGETSFLYDGWNVVSEICDDQSQITTNFYVWGLDLSGSLQGAGGIGGLLAAQLGTNTVVYTYDGNGNVSELINTLDGTIAAHYEYSPFGETLVSIGDLAKENTFRFSTKLSEDNTGLVLYEFRPYSPSLGRWVNRDPIGERGGSVNLYVVDTINSIDMLGLSTIKPWIDKEIEPNTVDVCKDDYGECESTGTYDFDCIPGSNGKNKGHVVLTIAVGSYWYADNVGQFVQDVQAAELQHYNAIKALYHSMLPLAQSHNKDFENECDCMESLLSNLTKANDLTATFVRLNTNIERWWHEPLGRRIRQTFCRK